MPQTEKQRLWYIANRHRILSKNKAKTKSKPKLKRVCKVCSAEFLSSRKDRKYCGSGCSKLADKMRSDKYGKSHKKDKVAYDKIYLHKNKERKSIVSRSSHLRRKYGITLEDYNSMFRNQNGRCAICNRDGRELAVDHDHTTGKIRGLLCFSCNTSIGKFNDDISILKSAINYIVASLAK